MAVEQEPHLVIPFLPQIQFFFAHGLEAIRRDPDFAFVAAGYAPLSLLLQGDKLDQWFAFTGNHDLFASKGAFDEPR